MRFTDGRFRLASLATAAIILVAACSSSGASSSPAASAAAPSAVPSVAAPSSAASVAPSAAAGDPNDLLAKIKAAGVIRVGTDPAYPPQSELKPDGTFEGFDIDTANEIGKRLGVKVKFETPDFSVVEAGKWAGRFDISVGSVTITKKRLDNLDFTEPYYFTPAQMAATTASGITTLEGLAGKTVCVGEGDHLLPVDQRRADARRRIRARAGPGRDEGHHPQDRSRLRAVGQVRPQGLRWLAELVHDGRTAIEDGTPMVNVGDPVFYEPLAVATDKSGPAHAELQAALDQIVKDMHADGTLTAFSKKWFEGQDLTTRQ